MNNKTFKIDGITEAKILNGYGNNPFVKVGSFKNFKKELKRLNVTESKRPVEIGSLYGLAIFEEKDLPKDKVFVVHNGKIVQCYSIKNYENRN